MIYFSEVSKDYVFIDHYSGEVVFYDRYVREFIWDDAINCSPEMIARLIVEWEFKEVTMESGTYYSACFDDTFYISFFDLSISEFYPEHPKIGETWRTFEDMDELKSFIERYNFEQVELEIGPGDYSASYAGSI